MDVISRPRSYCFRIHSRNYPLYLCPDFTQVHSQRLGVFKLSMSHRLFDIGLQKRFLFKQRLQSDRQLRVWINSLLFCR